MGQRPSPHPETVTRGNEVTAGWINSVPTWPVVISDIRCLFWPGPAGREACLFGWLGFNLGFGQASNYPWERAPQGVLRLHVSRGAAPSLESLATECSSL